MSYAATFPGLMPFADLRYARRGRVSGLGLDLGIPGVSIPGLSSGGGSASIPGVNMSQVGNAIVSAVGPPIIAALKKEIPGLIATLRPEIEAEVRKLEMSLWTSPEMKKAKKQAVLGAAAFALVIIGGTWAAVKFL